MRGDGLLGHDRIHTKHLSSGTYHSCIAQTCSDNKIHSAGKGEDESQRETNMVVQDWEEKIAEHLWLNACSFRGACINVG